MDSRNKNMFTYLSHKYIDCRSCLVVDTVNYDVSFTRQKDIYVLEFNYTNYSVVYHLSMIDSLNKSYSVHQGLIAENEILIVGRLDVKINNNTFPVFKLAENYKTIDGCINKYWTPDFGIFLIKSTGWGNYSKLIVEDPIEQLYLNILIEAVMQDVEFYLNCTEYNPIEIPPPPNDSIMDLIEKIVEEDD
jgi:hypothetical protein